MLVNSGSEANDLAWRIAPAATGGTGAIVTDHAYHGVTTAIADLSPEEWPAGFRPAHVETIAPAGATAVTEMRARGRTARAPLAATFIDAAFTSDGIRTPPPEEVADDRRRATHAAGGLFVADEVQAGYGRTGEHLWSFARYGITPDFVTLGKPMGNGYPVAAVITRRELVERFADDDTRLQHLRRQPGRGPGGARRARRDRGRAARRARAARGRAARALVERCGLGTRRSSTCAAAACSSASSWPTPTAPSASSTRCASDGVLIGRTGRDETCSRSPAARLRATSTRMCWRRRSRWRSDDAARRARGGGDAARDGGEALDEDAFAPYVDFLAAGGLDGLLALGTTGEGFLLRWSSGAARPSCSSRLPPGGSRSPCTAARSRPGTRSSSPRTPPTSAPMPSP